MNKFIRSYPQTKEWKARVYEPEFSNWVKLGILIVIAVVGFYLLNKAW